MKAIYPYLLYLFFFLVLIQNLRAVQISNIEELDRAAEFSFSIVSDNQGYDERYIGYAHVNNSRASLSTQRFVSWISANDEFCIGSGDHIFENRYHFVGIMENNDFFHNHFYPNVADHDNDTGYFYGVGGNQSDWGRGWVLFKPLNNFFNRDTAVDKIEFRALGGQVLSRGQYYDDQLVDYYARRFVGDFTIHMISIHYGDSSAFAPRSKNFMLDKLNEINAFKTVYDIVVVVTHCKGHFFKNALADGYMNQSEVDQVMTQADLVTDASNHVYERHLEYDHLYGGNGAMWVNTGAAANTGDTVGYVTCHVLDNPPRFTMQFIDTQRESSRKLRVGPKPYHSSTVTDEETLPYMKYINGPIVAIDWQNFPYDGEIPLAPETDPVINLVKNPSFESGVNYPENWVLAASASGSTEVVQEGGRSLKLTDNSSPTTQTITIEPNTNYNISMWVQNAAVTSGAIVFDTEDVFDAPGQGQFVVYPGDANNWREYSGSFNSGTNTTVKLRIFGTTMLGEAYFDNISLTAEGNGSTTPTIPVVSFESPSGNVSLSEGDDLYVRVYAADPDGIDRVRLYIDGVELARSEGGMPYEWNAAGQNDPELLSLSAGSFVLSARATDNAGDVGEASITVTVNAQLDPYGDWKIVNGVVDDAADDDNDGIENFMEYALGGDPQLSDANSRMPVVVESPVGGNFQFSFHRAEQSVIYTVEKSTDLINWSDYMTVTDANGLVGSDATVSIPGSEMAAGKLFLRLKVDR